MPNALYPIAVAALFSMAATPVFATDFFVDAKNGGDAADGISPATAWRTMERAQEQKLGPGDRLLLKAGSVWRMSETFRLKPKGFEGNPVAITRYGEGEAPELRTSIDGLSLGWRNESNGIWSAECGLRDVGNIVFPESGKGVSACGFKKPLRGELENEGDFWHDADDGRVYLKCAGDPRKIHPGGIEICRRIHVMDIEGCRNAVIDGVTFAYTGSHGIRGRDVRGIVIRNCRFGWIGGSYLSPPSKEKPMGERYGNGIEIWSLGDSKDIRIENCLFHDIYDTAMTNQGDGKGSIDGMHVVSNRICRCEQGYEFWFRHPEFKAGTIELRGNVFESTGFGWSHAQRPNKNATHILAYSVDCQKGRIILDGNRFGRTMQNAIWLFRPEAEQWLEIGENEWPGGDRMKIGNRVCGVPHPYARAAGATGLDAPSRDISPKCAQPASSKDRYLDLVEASVSAYSQKEMRGYLARVRMKGITEHGFPRLASNLGTLVATGRRSSPEDKALFAEMMDECCSQASTALGRNGVLTVGNDFSIKEVVLCILENERAGTFPKEKIDVWRAGISRCVAKTTYTVIPPENPKKAQNWAIFGGASEQARIMSGMGGDSSFVERQFAGQMKFFDKNGMYRDPGEPLVYDAVTRLQFMAAIDFGYDGASRSEIERALLASAEPTLLMQSATGEIPYGGRSAQFLHNETFWCAVCEWYAAWFKACGDLRMAQRFRAAARRAAESLESWMDAKPLRHVKNRYPRKTKYGCERYAYFDKYMVTMGSWAILARRFADESIPDADLSEDAAPSAFVSSDAFHIACIRAGGYSVQFDAPADPHYDGSGIGRIHRKGAPPAIALSVPFAKEPSYALDVTNATPLAILPGWKGEDDEWEYAYGMKPEGLSAKTAEGKAWLSLSVPRGALPPLSWRSEVSSGGVAISLEGDGEIALVLPVFEFDGERETSIRADEDGVSVSIGGWTCRYDAPGCKVADTGLVYGNRNGHYRRFEVRGRGRIVVNVSISTE